MSDKELLKAEEIRKKNDKLRKEGREPNTGWGKLVNTTFGGGASSGGIAGNIMANDKMEATIEDIGHKNS